MQFLLRARVVAAAALIGLASACNSTPPPADAPPMATAAPVAHVPDAGPPPAYFGDLPPLPDIGGPPPRPREVVQAVFTFAARHPEVLHYVPCFCGCQRAGHKDNDDCFIASRDASGRPRWDPHGMT